MRRAPLLATVATALSLALPYASQAATIVLPGKTLPGAPAEPRAARHALIIAIGDYMNPNVPALLGVGHDIQSASQMAAAMQVPEGNIRILRDHDATAARIEEEIADLNRRTQPGDRVFFYYSGHGTRYYSAAPADQGCVEALLPADGRPLTNARIANMLKPISDKTDKLFVFYDACHSGGIVGKPLAVTRSLGSNNKLRPKFSPGGAADMCAKPTNIRTRGMAKETARNGAMEQNVVLISSSRPDEVSFDDEDAGGIATQAWRDCMLTGGVDLDQSGAISVSEISACAQKRIELRFNGNEQFGAQHMTLGGNAGYVPGWLNSGTIANNAAFAAAATAADAITNAATGAAAASAPATTLAAALATTAVAAPGAALKDIVAQSDPRRKVKVTAPSKKLRIGKDPLELSVTSSHDGYVYAVLMGSDQKSYYMLFPNDLDGNNQIKAGETLKLPRPNWRIKAQGPAGTDRMLVVVSATPRDLAMLNGEKAGPFVSDLTDADGRARLQWLLGTSAAQSTAECKPAAKRDAASAERCSDAFGATLTEFQEL